VDLKPLLQTTVMAQAAATHGLVPRPISFKGTVQTLDAFQPIIESAVLKTRCVDSNCMNTYWPPLQRIEWRIDRTASSPASRNTDAITTAG
jgi:hypothetical protein